MTIEPGRAIGELVDDFHHFRATIEFEAGTITSVAGEALRVPWQTCGGAVNPLKGLEGAPLRDTTRAASRLAPAKLQCTHLYDAACIAVARAGRGAGSVVYRAIVPDRVDGYARPTLHRDGRLVLDWELDGYVIQGPGTFRGRALAGGGLADWAEARFDPDTCEAILILNRACMFATGRILGLDDAPRAIDVAGTSLGVCHTYSASQGPHSHRVVGSARSLADADDARRASLHPRDGEILHLHGGDG